jgi:hypothetical protein
VALMETLASRFRKSCKIILHMAGDMILMPTNNDKNYSFTLTGGSTPSSSSSSSSSRSVTKSFPMRPDFHRQEAISNFISGKSVMLTSVVCVNIKNTIVCVILLCNVFKNQ